MSRSAKGAKGAFKGKAGAVYGSAVKNLGKAVKKAGAAITKGGKGASTTAGFGSKRRRMAEGLKNLRRGAKGGLRGR